MTDTEIHSLSPNEFEDDFDEQEDRQHTIRSKWLMDGATTLSEAATRLRHFADFLVAAESAGWQLDSPVEDDYGFLTVPERIAALASEWSDADNPDDADVGFAGICMNVTTPLVWRCPRHPHVVFTATIAQRLAEGLPCGGNPGFCVYDGKED